ncbi:MULTISPECIES: hypothetical protein [Pseudoalteromonas]|uniref:Uncharacterized protein n=1 Tax=Pseudoalteromonas obscura TaxID=3048491 RepID=A0ABT7ERV5_9GAMM|nr:MULTISPECIES: hypothetical protein [Pseudoalteromonas]MBQ4839035.1 hypothetical protein [Pseudoalteromonas luteoviolacea]MDK2597773.1 hypothetical protein [Pseudoalteromonas sp. P94(2023)]
MSSHPDQIPEPPSTKPKLKLRLSRSKMNSILALCAILISAASFYATYMQAKAAQEQVTAAERQLYAETWPWLQVSYSDYDIEAERAHMTVKVKNSGTGPALIKSMSFSYRDTQYGSLVELLNDCCNLNAYQSALKEAQADNADINYMKQFGWYVTSNPNNALLADGNDLVLFSMARSQFNNSLWEKIGDMAHDIEVNTCYCSLLKQCYIVNKASDVKKVANCSSAIQ